MKHKYRAYKIYNGFIMAFLYIPIAVLIFFSFNNSKSRSTFTGFTLKWYGQLFQNDAILSALGVTLLRRLDQDGERFFHLGLSQVVAQFLRAQAAVKRKVVLLQVGRHRTIACRRGRSPLHRSCRLEDHSLYLNTVRHCVLFI